MNASDGATALQIEAVRAQFPSLSEKDGGMRRIYADNPAGTQVPVHVIERMTDYFRRHNANKGGTFVTSRATDELVVAARRAMAGFLKAAGPEEVVLGPSMTALTFRVAHALESRFLPGDEIIVTNMDHDGNVTPWVKMAERCGLIVKRLDFSTETWRYDLEALDELLSPRTKLAAINYASNITGTINDVAEIAARIRSAGGLTYVDAVQYAPHGIVDVAKIGCDFLVCSAYKFYGPHIAVLWGSQGILSTLELDKLRPVSDGLPDRFEQGTPPYELHAGLLGALQYYAWLGGTETVDPLSIPSSHKIDAGKVWMRHREEFLTRQLINGLSSLQGVRVLGLTSKNEMHSRVSTVSISVDGHDPASLERALSKQNIFVWSGHNYALDIIERVGAGSSGVLRIGPVHYNTSEEIDEIVTAIDVYLSANGG